MNENHDGREEVNRSDASAGGSSVSRGATAWLGLSLGLAKGILASRYHRRQAMFFGMLFVMGQAFLGAVVIESVLHRHPLVFAAYWLFCFVAVMFVLMLAFHDLLAVRREARERDRQLRASMSESIRVAVEDRKRKRERGSDHR